MYDDTLPFTIDSSVDFRGLFAASSVCDNCEPILTAHPFMNPFFSSESRNRAGFRMGHLSLQMEEGRGCIAGLISEQVCRKVYNSPLN